jgi:hypothetical protein
VTEQPTDGPTGPDDDDLLDRLRSHDPAAALAPADPALVTRLLEDAMSHDLDTEPHTGDPAGAGRRRSTLTWLVAAAAVLVIAGVGAFAWWSRDDTAAVPTATGPAPTVLALQAGPPVSGKCAPVSLKILQLQDAAFDGTVTAMSDGLVTLDVTRWYLGGTADSVTVQGVPADLQALVQAADFQVGQRYLVTANDGKITVCGFTAPYSDELAAMYEQAFGA